QLASRVSTPVRDRLREGWAPAPVPRHAGGRTASGRRPDRTGFGAASPQVSEDHGAPPDAVGACAASATRGGPGEGVAERSSRGGGNAPRRHSDPESDRANGSDKSATRVV